MRIGLIKLWEELRVINNKCKYCIINNYNIEAVKVQGLWADNGNRNAWVYLSNGHGWKKIGNSNDTAFINMLTQLISAKNTNSNCNILINNGLIHKIYVF